MRIKHVLFACLINMLSFSQSGINDFLHPNDTLNTSRRNAVLISETSIATLTLIGLHQLWYANYEKSKFHTFDDNNEWLQMDKVGHLFSTYQLTRLGANTLNWSGASKKSQLVYGASIGLGFLTVVEVFDGFSEEWGFSWGDMAANTLGTGFFVGQELLWNEQRMTLKYSFHRTKYALDNPDTLGDGILEEFLKDYNGQTYWLSLNLHSFFKDSKMPKWLNVAFGYGAEGMFSGAQRAEEELGIYAHPQRQFYLSLDVDLTKIKTDSHVLKTLFDVFNVVKLPFPALEFNGKNGMKFHSIYF
ncbi:MAG: DUF2279 domain-containing protein [Xanthomarina sp.]